MGGGGYNTQGGHNPAAAWAKPYGGRNYMKQNMMETGGKKGRRGLSSDNQWAADRPGKGLGSQAAGGPEQESCRLPAKPAVSMKERGLVCFLQSFWQYQCSTRMWSAGQLGRRHCPCNQEKSLRSLLKIPILGPHPSREDGLQIHAGIVPSGDSGAAGLAPDCAATVKSHT